MKRDHKGNPNKSADHVRLYGFMLQSDAWKDLSTEGRSLYVLLKSLYKGSNNGHLILSVRQAAEALHISKTTASKAFEELQGHGFIEVSIRGSFEGRKDRRATEWRLSELTCDRTGELPSKSFMRWKPGSNFTVRAEGQMVRVEGQGVPQDGLSRSSIPRMVPQRGL